MKVKCDHCNKVYEIPEKRLNSGKETRFPCPACKSLIELDLRSKLSYKGTAVDTSLSLTKNLLSGDDLKKKILNSIKDLPPMPQTVHKAQEIMSNPDSSFKDLARVLETDTAIAAMVLKMANSSYYGLAGKVSSIQHASVVLGQKTLIELITMAGTSTLLGDILPGYGLGAVDLWRHSMGVAFGARMIASKKNPPLSNDAFSAGLIHDSGKLILDPYILERKEIFENYMSEEKQSFLVAEKQILGFDHGEIASEVCKSWQTPQALANAIRYHHSPSMSDAPELTYIIHMADVIAMMTGLGVGIDGLSYQVDDKAIDILGLNDGDINDIMVEVAVSVDNISGQIHVA